MRTLYQCPTCHIALSHIRGARFQCTRCDTDYGLFKKQPPYSGLHRVRLTTPAQIRLAEGKTNGDPTDLM